MREELEAPVTVHVELTGVNDRKHVDRGKQFKAQRGPHAKRPTAATNIPRSMHHLHY
jgi:hypothetical protein